ncbi:MAG: hypothetical protein IRZ03_15685 [Acidobacterium ailaaui]|nr:hypothetical protein [Pseudacidobacterium ailaaui]
MDRTEYKINPSYFKLPRPVGFTVNFDNPNSVFNPIYTTIDQIKSQIINYVMTNNGERFYDYEFGMNLISYIFENIDNADLLKQTIKSKIEESIQYVNIQSVDLIKDYNNYSIVLNIDFTVNNDTGNVVISISQ